MFFPVRTDRALRKTPWVNYALIAANVVVFFMTHGSGSREINARWILNPQIPQLLGDWLAYPYLTYQFLHADGMHLLGNMIFLYVFGNSVEDRLGKAAYLAFYLAGGVLAGVGHVWVEAGPVLGASGSVCAVTGAYLALFPMSQVTILYFFIFIGTFEISSLYLILFQIAQNVFMHASGAGGVAYVAHLAGYLYGFLIGMGLLWLRLLVREPYDLLSMLEHRRRRARFRALADQGYQPWESQAAQSGSVVIHPPVSPGTLPPPKPISENSAKEQQIMDYRSRIHAAMVDHDHPRAAALYRQLLDIDPQQVMGQQEQLDLANQLTAEGAYVQAAGAYESFLRVYGRWPQVEQVELLAGLIYIRYLGQKARAAELLNKALPRLSDPSQRQLAQQLLAEIR